MTSLRIGHQNWIVACDGAKALFLRNYGGAEFPNQKVAAVNLCDTPKFTGYTRNGGFASHAIADAVYVFSRGRAVCSGIHMSDIPCFDYDLLRRERELFSVANLTRADGREFHSAARQARIVTKTTVHPLERANEALSNLRASRLQGAAGLVP